MDENAATPCGGTGGWFGRSAAAFDFHLLHFHSVELKSAKNKELSVRSRIIDEQPHNRLNRKLFQLTTVS